MKNFLNEESDSKRIKKADTKSVVIDANAAINQRSVESMSRSTASDGPSYGTEVTILNNFLNLTMDLAFLCYDSGTSFICPPKWSSYWWQ